MVPSIRSHRIVSNGGLDLSVACLQSYFVTFIDLYSLYVKAACMSLSMVPSSRSRRVVSNGGLHLSVAYDLTS